MAVDFIESGGAVRMAIALGPMPGELGRMTAMGMTSQLGKLERRFELVGA